MMEDWVQISRKASLRSTYVTKFFAAYVICGHLTKEMKVQLNTRNCNLVVILVPWPFNFCHLIFLLIKPLSVI